MTTGLIFAAISGLLSAMLGVLVSRVASRRLDYACFAAIGFLLATVACAALINWRVLLEGQCERTISLVALMLAAGFFNGIGFMAVQAAMHTPGRHGAIWAIVNSAMVIPFVFSLLYFGEQPGWWRCAGLVAVLASLFLFGADEPRPDNQAPSPPPSRRWFALTLLAFGIIGIQFTINTLPSHWAGWSDRAELRVPLFFAGNALTYLVWFVASRKPVDWSAVRLGLWFPIFVVPTNWFLYRSMDLLTGAGLGGLMYPLSTGVCIIAFAVYATCQLRERATAAKLAGFALGVAGVVLMSLKIT